MADNPPTENESSSRDSSSATCTVEACQPSSVTEVDFKSYAQKLKAENTVLKAELQEARQMRADLQRLFEMQEKTHNMLETFIREELSKKETELSEVKSSYEQLKTCHDQEDLQWEELSKKEAELSEVKSSYEQLKTCHDQEDLEWSAKFEKMTRELYHANEMTVSPTCHKKSCVHKAQKILGMEQEIQELKEQLKKFTPNQQMAKQHASELGNLSKKYDELMTNPSKGTILNQLEEQFEDKFDAKLVLGGIFMEAYDTSKNHLNILLCSIFDELYTVQPEESQGAEMESLSRAFSLMLNFAQVRSRLQHSSIQKQMCEQITNKMVTFEPSSRAKQPLDKINLRLDGVIDIAWRFVTEPTPIIVCQPTELHDDLQDKYFGHWEDSMEDNFHLLYARPVVYSSYHGHIFRKGFVGRVINESTV